MRRSLRCLVTGSLMLSIMSGTHAQQGMLSDAELMNHLKGAAPDEVVKSATIMNMTADGKMKTIQTGTGVWTCMEANGVPMCADQAGMDWAKARKAKGPAPQKLGFIYMLKGDNGTSNTDPFATEQTPNNNWIKTGPHVMIVGAEANGMMQAYPRDPQGDVNKPYVMWPGTPYEHLMLQVR
jgi:hypothetical protein